MSHHSFDAEMKCIRCRRPYAERAEPCDGPQGKRRELGAMAKRNVYRERAEREAEAARVRRAEAKRDRLAAIAGFLL